MRSVSIREEAMNSQRISGYERKPNDFYETPAWVTHALLPHIRLPEESVVYDLAAGGFAIVHALKARGWNAVGTHRMANRSLQTGGRTMTRAETAGTETRRAKADAMEFLQAAFRPYRRRSPRGSRRPSCARPRSASPTRWGVF